VYAEQPESTVEQTLELSQIPSHTATSDRDLNCQSVTTASPSSQGVF